MFRALVLACLVVAALDLRPSIGRGTVRPTAVIDVSASVGGGPPEVPDGLDVDSEWVLVADGTQVVVGGTEPARLLEHASDLGAGLRRALALNRGRDLILLSDGRDTGGDAIAAARAVREAGGRVFTRAPKRPIADVGLLSVQLLGAGATVRVRADIASTTTGRAVVQLRRGDSVIDRRDVGLVPGTLQSIELVDPDAPELGGRWRVEVRPVEGTPDDDPGDNALTVGRRGERREILVVGDIDGEAYAVPGRFGVVRARRLTPGALAAVDLVVLSSVPWADVAGAAPALEAHVERGGRLLLLGGPSAFGPGGWGQTALDELSPLVVEPPPGDGLLVVLLLDKSGSTEDGALAHLKSAARSALLGLRAGEQMGVLPFDSTPAPAWVTGQVLRAEEPAARDAAIEALEALTASGTTDIPGALATAIERAQGHAADTRWIVLLTDGDPDHRIVPERLAEVRERLEATRTEFAALVVGDEKAANALRAGLARRDDDVALLTRPSQFADRLRELVRERRLSREALPAPDRVERVGATLPELPLSSLPITAVHDLEPAPDATVLARAVWSDRTAPLIARRAAGVGAVWAVAWGPAFARDLEARKTATAGLGPLVHRLATEADRGLVADYAGDEVVVRLPRAAGRGALTVFRDDQRAVLVERAPGLFRGRPPHGVGPGLRVEIPGANEPARPLRLPTRPGAEHRGAGVDAEALDAIARAGGGRRLGALERIPRPKRAPGPSIATWLLLLAGILLVVERMLSRASATDT